MRRPTFPSANGPDAGGDSSEPPTQVYGRVPSADPRRPVRATRPPSRGSGASGAAGSGAGASSPFDPFGTGFGAAAASRDAGGYGDGGNGEGGGDGGSGGGGGGAGGKGPGKGMHPRRKRIIAWTAGTLAALLVVLGGYAAYSYFRFVGGVNHVDVIGDAGKNSTDQNILLVGDDHRPDNATPAQLAQLSTTQDGGGTNTDTMMILHIPADGKSATLVSLPRDSWVNVPGYGMNKLNSAFSLGGGGSNPTNGAKLLIKTVQNLTGLTINHYVRVSLLGFYTIAQALGPVQVCLNNAVNDPYSGANFPAGVSTLDAKQALSFVRQRHGLPRGDLDRVVRQQYFLSVEAHKFLSAGTLLNPGKLTNTLDAISGSLETDPGLNFLSLAGQLQGLTGGKIQSATIPIAGTPTITVDGNDVSIVQVDTAAMPAFIAHLTGTPSAYDSATAAKPSDTSVTVLNGGSQNGAASTGTQTLSAAGFKTGTPGDAPSTDKSVIEYPKGQESQAKAVAAYVPGATVEETSSVKTVTVILGGDGIMPAAPSAPKSSSGAAPAAPAPAPAPAPAATPASPTTNYDSKVCVN